MAENTDREQRSATDAPNANPSDAPPIRSSFSIDRYSREAIRRGAKWYGVTQGDFVNLAPLLYALIAERSLERRRQNLDAIQTQVEQAVLSVESIRSIAPHLAWAIDWATRTIHEIYEIEKDAIENREIHGVEKAGSEFDTHLRVYRLWDEGSYEGHDLPPSPFIETLKELRAETESEVVGEIEDPWIDDPGRPFDFQCFEGPRETELRERLGDYFAKDVIAGIYTVEEAEERKKKLDLTSLVVGITKPGESAGNGNGDT